MDIPFDLNEKEWRWYDVESRVIYLSMLKLIFLQKSPRNNESSMRSLWNFLAGRNLIRDFSLICLISIDLLYKL